MTGVTFDAINEHLKKSLKGSYEKPKLEKAISWLHKVVLPWLALMVHRASFPSPLQQQQSREIETLKSLGILLQAHVFSTFSEIRIGELFDIIVDYPDSKSALADLKISLSKTDQRRPLMILLKAAFEKRLLHPGANTNDILSQYVSTIKALKDLDPSGVILETVGEPIKLYLRFQSCCLIFGVFLF